MSEQIGLLLEIFQSSNGLGGVLQLDSPLEISPGQYLQVWRDDETNALPVTAYPASLFHNGLLSLDKIPSHWSPGDHVHIAGPMGCGFSLPGNSQFIVLIAPDGEFERILPLAQLALKQNASVSLISGSMYDRETFLSTLPEVLEVHDMSNIPKALHWADFLAIDLKFEDINELESLLGVSHQDFMPVKQGQVLIRGKMPCAGKAQCGICAIKTRSGWKFVCEDGPVFPLEELLHVAG